MNEIPQTVRKVTFLKSFTNTDCISIRVIFAAAGPLSGYISSIVAITNVNGNDNKQIGRLYLIYNVPCKQCWSSELCYNSSKYLPVFLETFVCGLNHTGLIAYN